MSEAEAPKPIARRRLKGAQPPTVEGDPSTPSARALVASLVPTPEEAAVPPREVPGQPTPPVPGAEQKPWEKRGPWGVVVESLDSLDVAATYQRLVSELKLGNGATEYGVVLAAMDKAESNAFDAGRLVRVAKLEMERVDLECDAELELLRTTARRELDQEKEDGKRSKAPTIQDVEDRVLANWPELVRKLKRRKAEVHAQHGTAEYLEKSWQSRCATLRLMADKVAGHR